VRVLFVYSLRDALSPSRPLATLGDIHIGVSYLSAYLAGLGHSTSLVVLSSEAESRSLDLLEKTVSEFNPHLIAFTAVSTQYPCISAAARRLKQCAPEKFLILGGVHASLKPEEVIRDHFDAVCVGEGEMPLGELTAQLEAGVRPRGIKNLWIKNAHGTIERNETREFMPALEKLPFPDREMWKPWVAAREAKSQVILPSRGCPYVCTYCSNHALRKLAPGKYVRLRPPANILDEIRCLKARYPQTSEIYLQSETIAINVAWLQELSRGLEALNGELEHKITYTCNFRVARAFLNDQVFAALQRANVQTVEIGLESGSERVRCDILRRHYSNADFLRATELARQYRMRVNIYNIIGLPGETLTDYWQTVELNRRVCPDQSITSIFYPYPGTDLYETCRRNGLLDGPGKHTAERWRATLDFPQFSRRQVQRAFEWFDYRIYRGHRPWHFRFRRVLRCKAYAHGWAHALFMRLLPAWHALKKKT
jgi:radical SAM superfamily enzyme YgiQ (UPF0313 family)